MTTAEKINDYRARCAKILEAGGQKAVDKQHARGNTPLGSG